MTEARPFATEQAAIQHLDKLEADLAAVRRELDHAHRLSTVGTMTAGLAHELNNILTPPLAYTQLAQSRSEDVELQYKAIDKARTGLESASKILRAVLEFSSAGDGSGSGGDGCAVANVRQVLDAAVDCLGRNPARDGIRVDLEVEQGVVASIDPLALQQVLLNLLLNARRALAERGGVISIRAKREPRPDLVKITVADDGPGIPESVRDTLFDPFVTTRGGAGTADDVRDDASDDRGGSGLGLTVCRRLIEDAGGTIVAHSTAGGGATFVVLVPACENPASRRSA